MFSATFRTKLADGFTIVETLVVLAIIAGMIGLLLPAVQRARAAGRSAVCQNNLRQLSIAAASHRELSDQFPVPGQSWMVTLLQWLEERPLMEQLKVGNRARADIYRPPIYRCPSQPDRMVPEDGALPCHYILQLYRNKKGRLVPGLPIRDRNDGFEDEQLTPWYLGPAQQSFGEEGKGPHSGLFNRS